MESTARKSNDNLLRTVTPAAHGAIDRFADSATVTAHGVVDKMADAATPAAKWFSRQGRELSATQKKLVGASYSYVEHNPVKSVAIAVAAGVILGRLFL